MCGKLPSVPTFYDVQIILVGCSWDKTRLESDAPRAKLVALLGSLTAYLLALRGRRVFQQFAFSSILRSLCYTNWLVYTVCLWSPLSLEAVVSPHWIFLVFLPPSSPNNFSYHAFV